MPDGSTRGRQWHPVETTLTDLTHELTKLKSLELDLPFRFADIGNSGVSR